MLIYLVGCGTRLLPLVGRVDDKIYHRHTPEHPYQLEVVEGTHEICLTQQTVSTLFAQRLIKFDTGHLLQRKVATGDSLIFGAIIVEQDSIVGIDFEVVDVVSIETVGYVLSTLQSVVGGYVSDEPL